MTRQGWADRALAGIAIVALAVPAVALAEDGNLLVNPGFEDGDGGLPLGWRPVVLPGGSGTPAFVWGDDAASGERAVEILVEGTARGLWQQLVTVEAGRVYTLSGQVAFDRVGAPGTCHLEAVSRGADGQVLALMPLPGHDGSRDFEPDYPYPLKLRAPEGAVG